MTASAQQIIEKYQGAAPQRVVSAVQNAAARTGADFSLLMQKASAESGFDPSAKAKSSSATGLFQFIESTWLRMVKEHGAKHGLGNLADKIEIRNGKPCVDDCDAKKQILNLRKNPEISALMAGELSAENRDYLEAHTGGDVGGTEMYLAHFLGAGGAAKFINRREHNGNLAAASLFPREARANRNVFYTSGGQPRTLNQVYALFDRKFGGTEVAKQNINSGKTGLPSPGPAPTAPAPRAHALPPSSLVQGMMAQALLLPSDGIIWHDTLPGYASSGFSHQRLSVDNLLLLAQMQHADRSDEDKQHYSA